MPQGRRNSVDVPLSKTLLALRRVRSLRDPDTNSSDKLSFFIDTIVSETSSSFDPAPSVIGDRNSIKIDDQCTPRSLSQTYRPRSFGDLIGQEIVARSLSEALRRGKISPVYLFHGPPGSGKTSTARIFAAALKAEVEELDYDRLDSKEKLKALFKRPIYGNFKVFIVEDCHQLRPDTWAAILNQQLSSQIIFIMITSDDEKMQHISLSSCQKFHFLRLNEVEIVRKLRKLCLEEGVEFDDAALTFVATRSNGSMREAETMLDQLTLLGKKITLSLAQELVGAVSEEELLGLLDAAISCDAPKTVRAARELTSKVDPTQLTSLLASLIVDILSGQNSSRTLPQGVPGLLQRLKDVLKVLSEADKQLESSRCRATWLTVALLQFNSRCRDLNDDFPICRDLDEVWRETLEHIQSDGSKAFLQKGRLTSIHLKQGVAFARVEFSSRGHAAKAESSWYSIKISLQSVLCREVELEIRHESCSSLPKVKDMMLRILGCSSKRQRYMNSRVHREEETKCRELQRSNSSFSFRRGRLGLPVPSREASLEALRCLRVPFVFCPKRKTS